MLALAGIAEAMVGMQIMVTWLGLFLIGGLSFLAFATQQRWIHISVLVMAILFGVMFVPWEIPFTPLTEKGREDPDVVTWHDRYLTLAYACYATMPLVIANFIQSVFRKPIPTTRTDVETLPEDIRSPMKFLLRPESVEPPAVAITGTSERHRTCVLPRLCG